MKPTDIKANEVEATLEELAEFSRRHILLSLALVLGLFALMGVTGLYFEGEVQHFADWMVESFGIWGMAAFLFVSDTFVSPFPPDLFLLIVAKSEMREHWLLYVSFLGIISTLAGHTGWLCGRILVESRWFPPSVRAFFDTKKSEVQRFGTWAVALGATTPLPFSVTCWTAGILKMPYKRFALAASTRFFRILIYYYAIHSSEWLTNWIS